MAIVKTLYLHDLEHKEKPLLHHKLGLMYTSDGYGGKIPTTKMVRLPGSKRWRRVYCAIWSNIGTCYVEQGPDWIVIS